MRKFNVTIHGTEETDGEMGHFVIEALRTGRRWRSNYLGETMYMAEEIEALEPAINDGEKLDPNDWVEISRAA